MLSRALSKSEVEALFDGLRYGKAERQEAIEQHPLRYVILTERNSYLIYCRPEDAEESFPDSHMGCIMHTRMPPQGGCDLADGPCTLETWTQILADIVSLEAEEQDETQP